jgi:hypothetical protein
MFYEVDFLRCRSHLYIPTSNEVPQYRQALTFLFDRLADHSSSPSILGEQEANRLRADETPSAPSMIRSARLHPIGSSRHEWKE